MSEDEFDNISDPFADVSQAEWSRILDRPQLIHQSSSGASPTRSTGSTDYGDDGFIDPGALAELDRIEASLSSLGGPSSTTRGGGLFSMYCLSQGLNGHNSK